MNDNPLFVKLSELIFYNVVIRNNCLQIENKKLAMKIYGKINSQLIVLNKHINLNNHEIAQLYIILDKYYNKLYSINQQCLLFDYWNDYVIASIYITMAIFRDVPETREFWIEISCIKYSKFLQIIFDLCEFLDYNFNLDNAKGTFESTETLLKFIN